VIAIQHILAVNEEKTALDDASETNLLPQKPSTIETGQFTSPQSSVLDKAILMMAAILGESIAY
jgi:hypothetical protein